MKCSDVGFQGKCHFRFRLHLTLTLKQLVTKVAHPVSGKSSFLDLKNSAVTRRIENGNSIFIRKKFQRIDMLFLWFAGDGNVGHAHVGEGDQVEGADPVIIRREEIVTDDN